MDELSGQPAFFGEFAPLRDDALAGFLASCRLGVKQQHLATGLSRDLSDTPAHGPGTDHGDNFETCTHGLDYRPGLRLNGGFEWPRD